MGMDGTLQEGVIDTFPILSNSLNLYIICFYSWMSAHSKCLTANLFQGGRRSHHFCSLLPLVLSCWVDGNVQDVPLKVAVLLQLCWSMPLAEDAAQLRRTIWSSTSLQWQLDSGLRNWGPLFCSMSWLRPRSVFCVRLMPSKSIYAKFRLFMLHLILQTFWKHLLYIQ